MISAPLPLDMELTGSVIADVELLLALASLLGLFLLIMVRRPVWGLVSFIFMVLTRVHEYIPGSQAFRPSVVVGIIMLTSLFIYLWINRQPIYLTRPQSGILIAFIAFCWTSLFTKGGTIYDNNGHILIEPLLLVLVTFLTVLNAVRNTRDFRLVLLALAWCGLVIAFLSLLQSFLTGVPYGRGSRWIFETDRDVVTRVGGLGIHPNDLPVTLAVLLPLYFFLLDHEKRSRLLKGIYFLSIPLLTLTVFLTYTRGGFICLLTACFLVFKKRLNAKYMIGLALLLTSIVAFIPGAFWQRLVSTGTTDLTGTGRLIIWQAALNMIQAHPLTGIGYGQFYYFYRDYGGMLWSQVSPHNTYLSIAAETGLLNFVIFLILSVATFFDLRQLKIKALNLSDPWTVHLSDTLKMSIIVALISGLTLDQSNWLLFYICVALVAVLKRICPQAHWATQVVSVSQSPSAISYHISLGQQR